MLYQILESYLIWFSINSLATYINEVKYMWNLPTTSTLKIVHIYRLYRDQSANVKKELLSRMKLLKTSIFTSQTEGCRQKKKRFLRFKNLFEEFLYHLKMPQTEPLLHVLMLSLLSITCSICLLFFFSFEDYRSSETAHIKNRNTGCIPIWNYNDFRFFYVFWRYFCKQNMKAEIHVSPWKSFGL